MDVVRALVGDYLFLGLVAACNFCPTPPHFTHFGTMQIPPHFTHFGMMQTPPMIAFIPRIVPKMVQSFEPDDLTMVYC